MSQTQWNSNIRNWKTYNNGEVSLNVINIIKRVHSE